MKHSETYIFMYKLAYNARPRHWRDRLGQWLRNCAELLDGRLTLALDMDSDPAVPIAVKADVVQKGLDHMERLFKDAMVDELVERRLKKAAPYLYEA